MAPRTQVTTPRQRPLDPAFAYFVKYFADRQGVKLLWTDSRDYAEQFAAKHRCYAKPALVQERSAWATVPGRSLGFSEASQVVK